MSRVVDWCMVFAPTSRGTDEVGFKFRRDEVLLRTAKGSRCPTDEAILSFRDAETSFWSSASLCFLSLLQSSSKLEEELCGRFSPLATV